MTSSGVFLEEVLDVSVENFWDNVTGPEGVFVKSWNTTPGLRNVRVDDNKSSDCAFSTGLFLKLSMKNEAIAATLYWYDFSFCNNEVDGAVGYEAAISDGFAVRLVRPRFMNNRLMGNPVVNIPGISLGTDDNKFELHTLQAHGNYIFSVS